MTTATVAVQPTITLRWMMQRDLAQVLPIAGQAAPEAWGRQDFLNLFQSADAAGWVAEVEDRVVGFLTYRVTWQPEDAGAAPPRGKQETNARPLRIVIQNLAVAPEWRRRGAALALLNRLGQKLRQAKDCVQVSVPESNLPLQLLLRKAGYKAVRVLRGHYGGDDAYLMERTGG